MKLRIGEVKKIVSQEIKRLREAAIPPRSEVEKARAIADRKFVTGADAVSIAWTLENMGFMPNVIDEVMKEFY